MIGPCVAVAASASGWWGRYEPPVILGVAAAWMMPTGGADTLQALGPMVLGSVLAYLRKPVMESERQAKMEVSRLEINGGQPQNVTDGENETDIGLIKHLSSRR